MARQDTCTGAEEVVDMRGADGLWFGIYGETKKKKSQPADNRHCSNTVTALLE